ncbi:hypothetical protein PU683_15520 [Kosakonia cowanii]|uniref:hypothetical protein n=1 Tax=Kosakonia cowanii TaxID=208223 RepID=UPI0023F80C23|nr:hypothetical protein [Kosakonia cowanii]MDF7760929.1 hypothetical protein [Kosakonia cowanii]
MSDQMNAVHAALTPEEANVRQSAPARKVGTLTNEQCKTSIGKSRSYFEQLIGFRLNESNSSSYTSFSQTYNLKISDRKDRLGGNYAICVIAIDPQTDKVTTFSMPV